MFILKKCLDCGKDTTLYVKDSEYLKFQQGVSVCEAFSDLDDFAKRLIDTDICYTCQEKKLRIPLPYNIESWGEHIGDCQICANHLYSKLDIKDISYICPRCKTAFVKIGKVLCQT